MRPTVRRFLLPAILVSVAVGIAGGIGGYTFVYANGSSYLRNDPAACANCHVMQEHFDAWQKSSHHAVATCNDCHTPSHPVRKYLTKASNGWHHSRAFTAGGFHEPIQITQPNRDIVEAQCRDCHAEIIEAIWHDFSDSCVRCHSSVGHLR